MSSFGLLMLCFQACLVQIAFGQLAGLAPLGIASPYGLGLGASGYSNLEIDFEAVNFGSSGALGLGALGLGNAGISSIGIGNAGLALGGINGLNWGAGVSDVAALAALPVAGAYGGTGYADLAVGGEMGASGAAVITGQIPVLGAVSFNGQIPASGVVSIAGNCGCASVPL